MLGVLCFTAEALPEVNPVQVADVAVEQGDDGQLAMVMEGDMDPEATLFWLFKGDKFDKDDKDFKGGKKFWKKWRWLRKH